MFMKVKYLLAILIVALLSWGCTSSPEVKRAHISGNLTVADSIDTSRDFSNIGLTVITRDSANADADTLFHTLTDTTGQFAGTAEFEEKRRYPMIISRNQQNLARVGVILADGDSVRISGQLPNLGQTISFSSREHDAMAQYQRVSRNFQRVMQYAQAGQITGDSLRQELDKWSNLFWQVYENNSGTIASELGARESIRILERLDGQRMMDRIREVQNNDELSDLGATYGKTFIANNQGLDPAISYLDSLSRITDATDKVRRIDMEQIKLLYDSARVDAAKEKLAAFKEQYPDDEASSDWVESMTYDLNYLSPGDAIPSFKFTENGRTVSRDSLMGSPYILEVTRLSNRLYQNQFDRTVVIHSIYKNYGLQVVTIPLDESQITVEGFFEERVKPWPVADAQAFDREQLLEKFNVRLIPTRFLINREGKIIRKYVGNEYDDVIQGIQTIIQTDKEPAS
jgi:glutathione peroxidase-family protein